MHVPSSHNEEYKVSPRCVQVRREKAIPTAP